jgi:hypothetical protein
MKTLIQKYEHPLTMLICALIVLYGCYGIYSALRNSLDSSMDVHLQWFPGQKILLGLNPYTVENADEAGLVSRPGIGHLPTNTALMNLLFLPLSWMSWETAGWVMRILNYALAAASVILALKLLPQRFPWWVQATAIMAFYSLQPVRETIMLGQTSLVILFTMLLALYYAPRNQWLAGIAFGIALSKYSNSLPLALYFWVFGYWRVLIVAALVQLGGFALLGVLTQQSIGDVIQQYINIARGLVDEPGTLDVTSMAQRLDIPISSALVFSVLFTGITLLVVLRRYGWNAMLGIRAAVHAHLSDRLILAALLFILALIVVYHRPYDGVLLLMLPIATLALDIHRHGTPALARLLTAPHYLFVWAIFLFQISPTPTIDRIFPGWEAIFPIVLNLSMLVVFAVLLWYCWHYRIETVETASQNRMRESYS